MKIPEILLSTPQKRKQLHSSLLAAAQEARKEYFEKDDRVFVLAEGKMNETDFFVSANSSEYIACRVTIQGSNIVVSPDNNPKRNWVLIEEQKVIQVADAEKIINKSSSVDIDTSHLDKLVLEAEAKSEIINVLKQHKHMNKIFKEWGLDEIMEYGKSMSMLFYGPPGTGKTWGATCIAKALNKELMVISAAEIQTSEPGGANRNIQQAFDQAARAGNVLFLDECDGLITDRSHVGMILASEINTLLTCLEKFEGVVIFATNRCDTLDPAMARRISLMVEFKEPDQATRADIWKVMLPKKMPLAKDVSIEKLAKFELTGGYIKNAILTAARTAAAEEANEVKMKHFAGAIKRIKATKDIMGTHTSRKVDFVKARG